MHTHMYMRAHTQIINYAYENKIKINTLNKKQKEKYKHKYILCSICFYIQYIFHI